MAGQADGSMLLFRRGAAGFLGPEPLRLHGNGALTDLVAGDVDHDGDDDLVVLREGVVPALLFNDEVQLSALRVAQAGRSLDFELSADAVDIAVVWLDLGPPLPFGFAIPTLEGLLRVSQPVALPFPPIQPLPPSDRGAAALRLSIPTGLFAPGLRFQVGLIRLGSGASRVVLGNAIEVATVPH